jgi:hypothetical protein
MQTCTRRGQPLCAERARGRGAGAGGPALAIQVASAPKAGHTVALGLDWGVNTLLTGTVGKLAATHSGDRVVTDGRMLRFDTTGISAKLGWLRGNRERVATRRDHYARLLGGLAEDAPGRVVLQAKHAALDIEHDRICARIRRLNHALAWAAARWAVDQAMALGASVIYVEDLTTLEARGRRKGNARLSGQVRGSVAAAIRHLGAKAGIAVVGVPARGTSKFCPPAARPCATLRRRTAPVSRGGNGLPAQAAGWPVIGITPHPSCSTGRPRTDPAASSGRRNTWQAPARPPSIRQRVDSPPRARLARGSRPRSRGCGQRPAGQVPQTSPHPGARPGPARDCRIRPGRSTRLDTGRGFHCNVRATVVLLMGDYGPPTARPRPPESLERSGDLWQSETLWKD